MDDHREVEKLNPLHIIKAQWPKAFAGHIKYDPLVIPKYSINRGFEHDGTLVFTHQIISEIFVPLLTMKSYWKVDPPDFENLMCITYLVGDLEITRDFGLKDLPCGRVPGMNEIVRLPVMCNYIYSEKAAA